MRFSRAWSGERGGFWGWTGTGLSFLPYGLRQVPSALWVSLLCQMMVNETVMPV